MQRQKNFGPVNTLFIRVLVSLFLCLALLACGDDQPKLERLKFDGVILAFGDSLTFGTGTTQENSYPAQLEKLTDKKVINAGIPGETTAEGLERLPYALEQAEPDLVLLCLGGNDMLRKMSATAMEANLRRMITLIQQSGAQVVLIGVPAPALTGLKAHPIYKTLAAEYEIPLDLKSVPNALSSAKTRSDRAHPNADGYRQIAESMHTLLRQRGAI